MSHPTPISTALSHSKIAKLEDQISELSAHIHAANYRFLMLVREFDAAQGWAAPGLMSCAHWLNWKCGIGVNAAREKVRVAHGRSAIRDTGSQAVSHTSTWMPIMWFTGLMAARPGWTTWLPCAGIITELCMRAVLMYS